jgi:hypothetical protein
MAGKTRSFSGARCQVRIDGTEVGWATGVEVDENLGLVRVDVMDDPYSQEIELVGVTVSGQVSQVVIYGRTLAEAAAGAKYPQGSKTDLILKSPGTLTILDSIEGKVLLEVQGFKFSSRHFSIDRNSVMMTNASFQAIKLVTVAQQCTT